MDLEWIGLDWIGGMGFGLDLDLDLDWRYGKGEGRVWIAYMGGEVEGKGMGWVGRANIHIQRTSEKTVLLCKETSRARISDIERLPYLPLLPWQRLASLPHRIISKPIANLAIKFPIHNYHHSLRSYLQG
jgi:hypothetical protein